MTQPLFCWILRRLTADFQFHSIVFWFWAFFSSNTSCLCERMHTAWDYSIPCSLKDYTAGIQDVFETYADFLLIYIPNGLFAKK
ncbi:MAG TPA: hypothetical protein VKN73_10860 [Desulfosalsimonadaceae bacterium]|nr:hypothetical protein [Desulfosalsimonadaceae bacterium]